MSDADADPEFDGVMRHVRMSIAVMRAISRLLPNGEEAFRSVFSKIAVETERKYREIVFRDKLDAAARERGERLLAKLRAELDALAKEHGA